MSYRPKPDVRVAIIEALHLRIRKLAAIYEHILRTYYHDATFSGWSWVDLELQRMQREGLVYYCKRSPGCRPGWYLWHQRPHP